MKRPFRPYCLRREPPPGHWQPPTHKGWQAREDRFEAGCAASKSSTLVGTAKLGPSSTTTRDNGSNPLLHILDVGESDPLGALLGVTEIELVARHEDRVAIDVVGDAGPVGHDEGVQLLPVGGGDRARQRELADLELHRERI